MHFGDRLARAVNDKRSPVCVGLDPRWQSLPKVVRGQTDARDYAGVAACTRTFCCEVIDAVADLVPIVKPQAAFFEQLGPHGMGCMLDVIHHATKRGLLVLLDGKRGAQALSARIIEAPQTLSQRNRRNAEEMAIVVENLVTLLDSIGGDLRHGRYPSRDRGQKVAAVLRRVADDLEA